MIPVKLIALLVAVFVELVGETGDRGDNGVGPSYGIHDKLTSWLLLVLFAKLDPM